MAPLFSIIKQSDCAIPFSLLYVECVENRASSIFTLGTGIFFLHREPVYIFFTQKTGVYSRDQA